VCFGNRQGLFFIENEARLICDKGALFICNFRVISQCGVRCKNENSWNCQAVRHTLLAIAVHRLAAYLSKETIAFLMRDCTALHWQKRLKTHFNLT
jgi:hypothetical protein